MNLEASFISRTCFLYLYVPPLLYYDVLCTFARSRLVLVFTLKLFITWESQMSLAYDAGASQEYATRTETHYMLHVPYAAIARVIREAKLEMHLIDNKIQINVAEARTVFSKGSHLFE